MVAKIVSADSQQAVKMQLYCRNMGISSMLVLTNCLSLMGRKKNTSHQINLLDYYIHWKQYSLYSFFSILQQQVFGPSDTVSLKDKNVKYTTAQQQQNI